MTGDGLIAMGLMSLAAVLWFPSRSLAPQRSGERARGATGLLPVVGVLGVVLVGYAVFGGMVGVVIGGVAAVLAWRGLGRLEGRVVKKRADRLRRLAPLVADLVASALAAGRDPASALELAAQAAGEEVADELAVYSATLSLGADPSGVWRSLGLHPQFGGVGRAFSRATDTGSSVTSAMRRGAEDLRVADRAEREARAHTVSTRAAAPLGLCLLPAFVVVGIVPLVAGAVEGLLF